MRVAQVLLASPKIIGPKDHRGQAEAVAQAPRSAAAAGAGSITLISRTVAHFTKPSRPRTLNEMLPPLCGDEVSRRGLLPVCTHRHVEG